MLRVRRSGDGEIILELQAREAGVAAVGGDEVVVATLFDDAALVHHDDAVGGAHGGEAVGDDDRRAVVHQRLARVLHHAFGSGAEPRGRLDRQDGVRGTGVSIRVYT